jgi:hypothetical protein
MNDNVWSREKEDMLKTYAEESECLYITYTKDFKMYRLRGYAFTIPAIIISTVTGLYLTKILIHRPVDLL